jgi:hypothetical protein
VRGPEIMPLEAYWGGAGELRPSRCFHNFGAPGEAWSFQWVKIRPVPSLWLRRVRLPPQRPELPVAQLRGESPRDGAEQPLTLLGRGRVTGFSPFRRQTVQKVKRPTHSWFS